MNRRLAQVLLAGFVLGVTGLVAFMLGAKWGIQRMVMVVRRDYPNEDEDEDDDE